MKMSRADKLMLTVKICYRKSPENKQLLAPTMTKMYARVSNLYARVHIWQSVHNKHNWKANKNIVLLIPNA